MNRTSIVILVIGAMLFGCGVGMVAHEVMEPEAVAQAEWAGQKFEYHFAKGSSFSYSKDVPVLNELGQEGWELVMMDTSGTNYWLKRPLN